MSSNVKMFITTIVGVIVGLLEATGHLDSSNGSQLQNDASAVGGVVITIISSVYLFEHLLLNVKKELEGIVWEPPKTPAATPAPATNV